MNITIIGTGFVGVVSGAVYASLGHNVIGLDIDQNKIESLRQGKVPFFEPGLEDLLIAQQKNNNLSFTTDYQSAIAKAEIIIIAVGTPSAPDGQADLRFVLAAAQSLAPHLVANSIIVIKSTVPPGTLDRVANVIRQQTSTQFYMASLPEFLREGSAVKDTLHPDRIVIGATDDQVFAKLEQLHQPFGAPILKVRPESAQMGKYTANAYLALRITFVNQIADLCEKNGADVNEVISIIGHDSRIGHHYWYPGFGYGGSCFPKDVQELAAYSRSIGEADNLMIKMHDLNVERIPRLMAKYEALVEGFDQKQVAVLGLSFKPNTNDMREAPSIAVIDYLVKHNARVVGYDPKAVEVADFFIKPHANLSYATTVADAIRDADVIMALIEWPEITNFDFAAHKQDKPQLIIDARNQLPAAKLRQVGYSYIGVGIGS